MSNHTEQRLLGDLLEDAEADEESSSRYAATRRNVLLNK